MNGEQIECPACKSKIIGRAMGADYILYYCVDCKNEWKEMFKKDDNPLPK